MLAAQAWPAQSEGRGCRVRRHRWWGLVLIVIVLGCGLTHVPSPHVATEEALFAQSAVPWEYEDPALHTAVGLLACVTLLPAVFALTQMPRTAKRVWPLLDDFLAIFLAVAWFKAYHETVRHCLESATHAVVAFNCTHTLLLYALALSVLWRIRHKKYRFLVCGGMFAHFVSFGAMKTGVDTQEIFFSQSPAWACSCCMVVLGAIVVFFLAKRFCLHRFFHPSLLDHQYQEWDEVSDEIMWDAAGMTLAVLITQAMHYVICGMFDTIQEPRTEHTSRDVMFFLSYTLGLLALGIYAVPALDHEAHAHTDHGHHWWLFNFAHVLRNVIVMMVAWAHLLLLRWLVLEGYLLSHRCSPLFAALLLAIGFSGIAMALIYCMPSKWHGRHSSRRRKRTFTSLVLQTSSLVCAWCWEGCFDEAIDALSPSTGWSRVRGKWLIALTMTVMVGPIYVHFVKPKAAPYERSSES